MVDKVLNIPRLPQFDIQRLVDRKPGPGSSPAEIAQHVAETTEYLRRLNVCLVEWFDEWALTTNEIIENPPSEEEVGVYTEFCNGLLTASNATYYTVPVGKIAVIKDVWLANKDSATRSVTVYRVPNGSAAGDANAIMNGVTVEELSAYQQTGDLVLAAGGTLQAFSDVANKVTMTVTGILYDA